MYTAELPARGAVSPLPLVRALPQHCKVCGAEFEAAPGAVTVRPEVIPGMPGIPGIPGIVGIPGWPGIPCCPGMGMPGCT